MRGQRVLVYTAAFLSFLVTCAVSVLLKLDVVLVLCHGAGWINSVAGPLVFQSLDLVPAGFQRVWWCVACPQLLQGAVG